MRGLLPKTLSGVSRKQSRVISPKAANSLTPASAFTPAAESPLASALQTSNQVTPAFEQTKPIEEESNWSGRNLKSCMQNYTDDTVQLSKAINSGAMGLWEALGPGGVVDKKFIKMIDKSKTYAEDANKLSKISNHTRIRSIVTNPTRRTMIQSGAGNLNLNYRPHTTEGTESDYMASTISPAAIAAHANRNRDQLRTQQHCVPQQVKLLDE
jgi:hypothetical protein